MRFQLKCRQPATCYFKKHPLENKLFQEHVEDQRMHSDFLGKLRQLMTLLLGDRRLQGLGYPGLPEDQVHLLSGGGCLAAVPCAGCCISLVLVLDM